MPTVFTGCNGVTFFIQSLGIRYIWVAFCVYCWGRTYFSIVVAVCWIPDANIHIDWSHINWITGKDDLIRKNRNINNHFPEWLAQSAYKNFKWYATLAALHWRNITQRHYRDCGFTLMCLRNERLANSLKCRPNIILLFGFLICYYFTSNCFKCIFQFFIASAFIAWLFDHLISINHWK